MWVPSTKLEGRVLCLQLRHQFVGIETLGIAVIKVQADGGVEHLRAYIQGAAEFVGGLGFLRQFHRDGFIGLVVAGEELQNGRVLAAILQTSVKGPR